LAIKSITLFPFLYNLIRYHFLQLLPVFPGWITIVKRSGHHIENGVAKLIWSFKVSYADNALPFPLSIEKPGFHKHFAYSNIHLRNHANDELKIN
jgi:hypothetical protein